MAKFMEIEIMGDKVVKAKLLRGAAAAGNMRPALTEVRLDMFRVIRATFTGQGRRFGGSWKALDPKTVAAKARKGQDPRILIATHRLIDAFTRRESRHMRSKILGDRIELGSDLTYDAVHQYGSDDGNTPARPFIAFYPQDRQRWAKICQQHLMGAMRGV
jgi:phage gpG-like protein